MQCPLGVEFRLFIKSRNNDICCHQTCHAPKRWQPGHTNPPRPSVKRTRSRCRHKLDLRTALEVPQSSRQRT